MLFKAASRAGGGQGAGGHVSRERRRRQPGCGHARGCCWGPVTVATGGRASGHRRGNPGRARGNHLSMRRHHRPQLAGSAIAVRVVVGVGVPVRPSPAAGAAACPVHGRAGRRPQALLSIVRRWRAAGRPSPPCRWDGTMAAQSLVLMHDRRRHRTSGAGRTCTPRGSC